MSSIKQSSYTKNHCKKVGTKRQFHTLKQKWKPTRSRNIIWFNPSFTQNVKTNIGKIFLNLIKKHFPNHHRLHKIFNLNTIKLSYSCMSNMSSFIKQHNRNILFSPPNSEKRSCNCRNKDNCPLAGNCLKTCIIYRADVIKLNETHVYCGASHGEFKYQYNNHTNSFRNRDYENKTYLAVNNGTGFNLKWNIAAYATPYRCGTRRCHLCLTEKYFIAQAKQINLLNKRIELISKCWHRNK